MDKLNSLSYAAHYRHADSTQLFARRVMDSSFSDGDAKAEALNNLAFVSMTHMDYDLAQRQLDSIPRTTDNQLELLVAYVQYMRLCQRRSHNKDFYDYRERALSALRRLNEERAVLTPRQQRRLLYAETELAIVNSTYYYYVGLEQQSVDALAAIDANAVKGDTAQFLNYLYNIGAGGIITDGSAVTIYEREVDCLLRCYQIAQRGGYIYFVANALEALSEHIIAPPPGANVSLSMVNPFGLDDQRLAVLLAEESLTIFNNFGDVYQTAGAYRTLASCYRALGDYEGALDCLHHALADTLVFQAPDLVASICEQLSVAYAAVDDKPHSDHYRNRYLDLQEQTRQDRQLEARAGQLDRVVSQLNALLTAVVVVILLLLFLLWLFRHLNRHAHTIEPYADLIDERREQLDALRLHIEKGQRRHLDQRARISLVNSLLPLIDRMVYTLQRHGDRQYVVELIDKINADNQVLTQWIQLRQGQLSLHIESFPLQPLFDILARSQKAFLMHGITLTVMPTDAVVKADRILTLFMLNTLTDNARKFTPEGGTVTVDATEAADYVELAVTDTGVGLSSEQLAHLFDRQSLIDDHTRSPHGFGLLNCKGIVDKYRKLSPLFRVCTLQADSQPDRGSRFFFRLPKGIVRWWVVGAGLLWWYASLPVAATPLPSAHTLPLPQHPLSRAAIYADSAYFSNINGTYERTLRFADSCRQCLNAHYLAQRPDGRLLLLGQGDISLTPPEVQWLHDSVSTNYNLILDIRNESAVAALALHQWSLYQYNNRIYTQLFKELSADATLGNYCRTMQKSKTNRTTALVLLLLTLLSILPLWYFFYLRPRLNARFHAERAGHDVLEQLSEQLRLADRERQLLHVSNAVLDNCLSALKHETMYYPARISQLIAQGDIPAAAEVAAYYRELYTLLSLQAQSQVDRVHLHLQHLDHDILGDPVLISYLYELLRRLTGRFQLDITYSRFDEQYVRLAVTVAIDVPPPATATVDRLLCRQIVRDHGEATHRRACSISRQDENDTTQIIVILPAYGKV